MFIAFIAACQHAYIATDSFVWTLPFQCLHKMLSRLSCWCKLRPWIFWVMCFWNTKNQPLQRGLVTYWYFKGDLQMLFSETYIKTTEQPCCFSWDWYYQAVSARFWSDRLFASIHKTTFARWSATVQSIPTVHSLVSSYSWKVIKMEGML